MYTRKLMVLLTAAILLLGAGHAAAQSAGQGGWGYGMGPGMMGGYGMHPGYGMGPGMQGGYGMYPGYGMGPGMMGGYGMHPGYGMGPGMQGGQEGWYCPFCGRNMPGWGGPYPSPDKPLDEAGARGLLEAWLRNMRNPNLKVGKVTDAGSVFEAEIVTKEGSLADKVFIDKGTGWMRPAY